MRTKRTQITSWLLALTLGAAVGAAAAAPGAEEDEELENPDVTMKIKGLACPFCVHGLEKKIRQVPHVRRLATDLKRNRVRIALEPNRIDRSRLRKAVERAGFTPGKIDVAEEVDITD